MKGRKGKKGSKNAPVKNNGTTNPPRHAQQPATQPAVAQPQSRSHSQGTQSEEYYEDDDDDDYIPPEAHQPLSPPSAQTERPDAVPYSNQTVHSLVECGSRS